MNHRAINSTEAEERAYLKTVKEKLRADLAALDERVRRYAEDIQAQKDYMWESRAEMDRAEKMSARQTVRETTLGGEAILARRNRIAKLIQSPYFGRFDFLKAGEGGAPLPVYVGIHSFVDEAMRRNIVYDWRAPISTLFYDFELGAARYDSPSGRIAGEISLKRQYRIRDGEMQFMLESGLNILDDVLQEELSRASDDRMKNIVATIQRDQNAVIRNEDAPVLIIQGTAGSGKTSIALHRIAFLLYRFKETLSSKDILIISPNKVFADFISNVLPELGEEQIAEMGMEELARELLENKVKFQTFFEQSSKLLEKDDPAMRERIIEKSSLEFLKKLDAYVDHVEKARFTPRELRIGGRQVPEWFVEDAFNKRRGLPVAERLNWAAERIEQDIYAEYRYEITSKERSELKASLKKMFKKSTLRATYKELFTWLGRPELFKTAGNGMLEYADVYPLIYLKMRLEGIDNRYTDVKHLIIDEMQDYTAVQYAVLARLFPSDKTILGDIHQAVTPFSASSAETINGVFHEAECVSLTKSYRSSFEIMQFARGILPGAALSAVERHGDVPEVIQCKNNKDELTRAVEAARMFHSSDLHTMGIICKTERQASALHEKLLEHAVDATLLTPKSTAFKEGVVVCSAHLAKGLEFDCVFIPHVTEKNFATDMERHLLYVACTRAMHRLILTHAGAPSSFLENAAASH